MPDPALKPAPGSVLVFDATGTGHGLYTEAIDLHELGPLRMRRASSVEFDPPSQQWEVRLPDGTLLYRHHSRGACLAWERRHFNQQLTSKESP